MLSFCEVFTCNAGKDDTIVFGGELVEVNLGESIQETLG